MPVQHFCPEPFNAMVALPAAYKSFITGRTSNIPPKPALLIKLLLFITVNSLRSISVIVVIYSFPIAWLLPGVPYRPK